jgi:lysyl-tRNA synthetase class 1
MYWADKIARQIIDSGKFKPYWVDDMKTPSGFAHVGSLRGPIIHSLVFRALKDAKVPAKFTFVFNDFDPADEFPREFAGKLKEHAGEPLKTVPSPDPKYKNLADLLADDLKETLVKLGVEAEFLSSWEMYHQGKFDEVIKLALDDADKIQDIYQKVSGSKKREKGWLPFQVICEKCGKLGTTRVYAWDGKEVSYKCEPSMVTWAKGCGHEGKISPFGGNGKLPWKVDWSAHWKVIGVTIEAAGKDHASKGGSYDIALTLCDEVFDYPKPFNFGYEFFLIGGRKMSSSKGLGLKAHDLTKILPPELARFVFSRTDYRQQINFDPAGTMAIPDLFDEYDRCWQSYIEGKDEDLARTFELAQIEKLPDKSPLFLSRFREVAQVVQMPNTQAEKYFTEKKGSALTKEEKEILDERIEYANVWLKDYAPEEARYEIKTVIKTVAARAHIVKSDKVFFAKLIRLIEEANTAEELEKGIYALIKESGFTAKEAFAKIYKVLIQKTHGPKAAWLIWENKEKAIKLFKEASK